MKQINNQSDLISMSGFAGLSYLTTWSSVCIILIWDLCICNLHNLCQTGYRYRRRKPHQQRELNFNEQEYTSFSYSLLLSGQFQLKLFYCGKGRQNFASNVTLYPCERSRQNHLERRAITKGYDLFFEVLLTEGNHNCDESFIEGVCSLICYLAEIIFAC